MSNFRNTPDLLDGVLRRCGEITSDIGISPRTNQALLYLNRVHHKIISGGNELEVDVDESWAWARARRPIIVNLTTGITAGTCSLTYKSSSGTFSSIPVDPTGTNISVQGYFLRPTPGPEVYRITSHTAGQTAFSLDGLFQQASNSALNYWAYQLDYDLVTQVIVVDSRSDTMDFIENSGTPTVLTASIAHGTYSPSGYATAVAAALNAAGTIGNTYACAYNAVGTFLMANRTFTVSVTLNATNTNAAFSPQGATGNYYRSAWTDSLGFDFTNYSGATSYSSVYPLSFITKLTQPARLFYGTNFWYSNKVGQLALLDPVRFDRDNPLVTIQAGTPTSFTELNEYNDGTKTIRINRYPWPTTNIQGMRVEFDYIGEPRDLFNNQFSIPQIPRKYLDVLEFGAAHYLSRDKGDKQRAADYLDTAQKSLIGMMKDNRKLYEKAGRNFGNVIARPDMIPENHRLRPFFAEPYGSTQTPQAGAGSIIGPVQLSFTQFQTGALSKAVAAITISPNQFIFDIIMNLVTSFAGSGISQLNVQVGNNASASFFISNFNGLQSAPAQQSSITTYAPGSSQPILVTLTAVGANLSALTQGQLNLYFSIGTASS